MSGAVHKVDLMVAVSLYVRCKTPEEAAAEAAKLKMVELTFKAGLPDGAGDMIWTSSQCLDDPEFPRLSFSPEATIHGPWEGEPVERMYP